MNSLQGAVWEIFFKFVHRKGIYIFFLDVIRCSEIALKCLEIFNPFQIPSNNIDKYDYNEVMTAGYFNVIVWGRQMHSS